MKIRVAEGINQSVYLSKYEAFLKRRYVVKPNRRRGRLASVVCTLARMNEILNASQMLLSSPYCELRVAEF